jgi:hypothetical protein
MTDLSPNLLAYLKSWHNTTITRKSQAGYTVDLPFEDFLGLLSKRQLSSLQKAIDEHRLQSQQSRESPYALVATWRSYAACSSGRYDKTTATICSRMKSAPINMPRAGDKLRDSHRTRISEGLAGKRKSAEHRQAISQACAGTPKAGWSDERKAERRKLLAAKKAAARSR